MEYLIPTDNIILLFFYTQIWQKTSSLIDDFSVRFNEHSEVACFLGPPRISVGSQPRNMLHKQDV